MTHAVTVLRCQVFLAYFDGYVRALKLYFLLNNAAFSHSTGESDVVAFNAEHEFLYAPHTDLYAHLRWQPSNPRSYCLEQFQ